MNGLLPDGPKAITWASIDMMEDDLEPFTGDQFHKKYS